MPEVESRVGANTIDQVLAEFDLRKDHLADLSNATERLIKAILKEEAVPFQSVQARVKRRDKVRTKYCSQDKNYRTLDEIPDLDGLRIITYYSDKIDQIAEIIGREFAQCAPREDKRLGKLDSFGYSAIHMDCTHSPARLGNTEYKRFADARFEVQITTILGHAWAEMHHPWYDELNSPSEELRRFHRLAAVLELAEQEFLEIRKKKDDRERIASVRVEAQAPEIPITVESLKALIEQKGIVFKMDNDLAAILGGPIGDIPTQNQLAHLARLVTRCGISTVQDLEEQLTKAAAAIEEYVTLCKPIWMLAQGQLSDTYTRGFSIFHLVGLTMGALGDEKYEEFVRSSGGAAHPRLKVDRQVAVAMEVVRKHHL
jgi:ppGpp synthetase/RelA/SpoT-type nucleotidyltranferase